MRILLATLHYVTRSSNSLADEALEIVALGNDVCIFAVGDIDRDPRGGGRHPGSEKPRVLASRGDSRLRRSVFLAAALLSAAARHPLRLTRFIRAARRQGTSRSQSLESLRVGVPILAQQADVIHFAWIDLAKVCIDLLPLLDTPVVVSCTGSDLLVNPLSDEKYHERIQAVFEHVDLVRCLSNDLREHALELGLDPSKVVVIPRGVDTDFFCPAGGQGSVCASTVVKPRTSALRLVSVGHLHWVKGYEYALQALGEVRKAGVEISYEILGADAGALMSVRTAIRDLGLEEHVTLRGECSRAEVLEALRSADVFMLASLSEGRCTAKLEAMAVGVPVVVADVGGMGEGLTHGVNAMLVPPRDPAALANALLELASDPARRRRMGDEGRKRVSTDWGATKSAQLMLEQYQRLIDERSNP